MTVRKFLSAISLAAAIVACEPEQLESDGNSSDEASSGIAVHTIKMSASSETSDTKVSLNGTSLLWNEGDEFRVLSENGVDWKMTLSSTPGLSSGEFQAQSSSTDIDVSTMAVFPYSAFEGYSSGSMTITVPKVQHYQINSFDPQGNIMAGSVTKVDDLYKTSFKNLLGVLKLSLTGDDEYLSSIELSDNNGKLLWGTASVPVSRFTEGISSDNLINGGSTITLNCHGAKLSSSPTAFYFVVPTGSFEGGFTVTLKTMDDREASIKTTKKNMVVRSSIKPMPEIAVKGFETSDFNIQNDAVTAYMAKTGDPVFCTSFSLIFKNPQNGSTLLDDSILKNNSYLDQDRPNYKTIQWDGDASASYYVTFTDETTSNDVYANRSVTGNSHDLINMIPEHTYSYVVKDNEDINGSVVAAGKFKATGQVRMVTIEDSWNYRDLGGWSSTLGGAVNYGLIYRGASLNGKWQKALGEIARKDAYDPSDYIFSKESRTQIKDMGIKVELDLRATYEESIKSDSKWASTKKTPHENALGQDNTGLGDLWSYFRISSGGAQENPLDDNAAVADVALIIEQVLNDKPVAFHCKSGADRTGCVAMLVLSVLGVNPGDVCRDYELTTFSREYAVLEGSSRFREKKASEVKYEYKFFHSGFTTLKPENDASASQQKKAYYYLNQQFASTSNPVRVDATTLDRFISKMLGISYTHPSDWTWAN